MNKSKCILVIIILFFLYSDLITCTCLGTNKLKNIYKYSEFVFSVKVIESNPIIIYDSIVHAPVTLKFRDSLRTVTYVGDTYYKYKCKVKKTFKGNITLDTIEINTPNYKGGSCGSYFITGNDYIVFCKLQNKYFDQGMIFKDFFYTDICSGNLVYSLDVDKKLTKLKKKH